ncbi:hypothetical protein PTSG_08891 [Salpingoeca rosetta]|uniref:Uncharacterized protein n=1 Tax=Salpingoeca rosetta (strain ATCC 50818 / BSB-021) TaxID=946362 RepID=F2UL02_SALR5|nr:uncharacterized protein PTSG_08891 [Salpingoeca rosetta]EGD77801.1 hypothetical protein PTSG_08891 [Salpingoeca rosetta]|eukprot:XP_004990277.1 hypothetical protein PTSG_08891 [Salpingoeca rosetta]
MSEPASHTKEPASRSGSGGSGGSYVLVFRDFVPARRETSRRFVDEHGVYKHAHKTESFASLMDRVNRFIASEGVKVVNVETLQLPYADAAALTEYKSELACDTGVQTMVQCVRLWYMAAAATDPHLPEAYACQFDEIQGRAVPSVEEL